MKRKRSSSGIKQACGPAPGLALAQLPNVGSKKLHWADGQGDYTAQGAAFTKGLIGDVAVIERGDAYDMRLGDKIHVKQIDWIVQLQQLSVTDVLTNYDGDVGHSTEWDAILILDKCHTGATVASIADIFSHCDANGGLRLNMVNRNRFKVLHRERLSVRGDVSNDGTNLYVVGGRKTKDVSLKMDIPLTYTLDVTTGTVSDLEKNALITAFVPRSLANDGEAVSCDVVQHVRVFFTT